MSWQAYSGSWTEAKMAFLGSVELRATSRARLVGFWARLADLEMVGEGRLVEVVELMVTALALSLPLLEGVDFVVPVVGSACVESAKQGREI
jgi:hypothetical protein